MPLIALTSFFLFPELGRWMNLTDSRSGMPVSSTTTAPWCGSSALISPALSWPPRAITDRAWSEDLLPARLPRRMAVSGCMLQRPLALPAKSGSSALWVICQQLAYQSARTPAHPISTPPQPRAVMLTQTHVYKPSESQTLWDELPQQKHWLNLVSMWLFKWKVLTTQSRILFLFDTLLLLFFIQQPNICYSLVFNFCPSMCLIGNLSTCGHTLLATSPDWLWREI